MPFHLAKILLDIQYAYVKRREQRISFHCNGGPTSFNFPDRAVDFNSSATVNEQIPGISRRLLSRITNRDPYTINLRFL